MPRNDRIAEMRAPFITPDGTAYIDVGAGEALVFVHGVGMNRRVWEPQLTFTANGFRVIAYDLPGHGDSRLPPESTTLEYLGDQLARLLDHIDVERAHLVGHSMGALVVLDFALRHPGRVHRLVALNAVYRRSSAQRASVVERARQLAAGDMDFATEAAIERWLEPNHSASNHAAIDHVRTWLQSVDRRGYSRIYHLFATADDAFVGRLGELQVPALFATGERDPNSTPAMSRQMADTAPAGRALVIEGKRHMMAFFAPELVNPEILGFLSGRASTATASAVEAADND